MTSDTAGNSPAEPVKVDCDRRKDLASEQHPITPGYSNVEGVWINFVTSAGQIPHSDDNFGSRLVGKISGLGDSSYARKLSV